MDKIYIVMPAYNEQENIESVVLSWYSVLEGKSKQSKLVVADSGSTDKTHEILKKLQKENLQLEILSDTGKQHGPKLLALYDYAIKSGADYIFQTDSDGQTIPEEFVQFWDLREKYDVILGKRLYRGDGILRKLVEDILCILLKLYFRVELPDANAPYRLMKTEIVKKYLYDLPQDYNLPNVMLTTYFKYYKERIKFVSITFKSRQGGKNSINISKIIRIGWKALYDFNKLKKSMK